MKQLLFTLLFTLSFSIVALSQGNPVDAQDDYFEQMGSTYYQFYPLANDIYPADSLVTFTILGSVDCADVIWDDVNNALLVTFTDMTLCSFNYTLCDNLGNCDIAQITLQYFCYPWDYIAQMVDLLIDEPEEYSFNLMNDCSPEAELLLDFVPDSIAYTLEDGIISFSGDYLGEEYFSYYVTETDIFGCIVCGTFYEYNLTFDYVNSTANSTPYEIKIYPNPASENIKVISNSSIVNVHLVNLNGQKTQLSKISENEFEISKNPPGNYLILVEDQSKSYIKTIQIQ